MTADDHAGDLIEFLHIAGLPPDRAEADRIYAAFRAAEQEAEQRGAERERRAIARQIDEEQWTAGICGGNGTISADDVLSMIDDLRCLMSAAIRSRAKQQEPASA